MATQPTINTDYLKFDAASIKSLISQKLSEDTSFTDYVYDGSNLSIFIDIFSNMFQVLMYNLNNTASESMFTDTQIYENINRLVKFIGYNPRGYTTSTVQLNVTYNSAQQGVIVPPYSTIALAKTDSLGNTINYSTVDYYYLYNSTDTSNNIFPIYNGKWIKYNTTFVSEGIPYEKFVLPDLVSDSTATTPTYMSYPYVHVYIKRLSNPVLNTYTTLRFDPTTNGLFVSDTTESITDSTSQVFNLRLNEYKQYEIQFGDGIHCQGLQKGDIVTIVYLDSNGPSATLNTGDISSANSFAVGIENINPTETDPSVLSLLDIITLLFNSATTIINAPAGITSLNNIGLSTTPTPEETVANIQANAPQWFKSVGRLITQKDFDYFIRTNFYNDIIDIKVMNNWQYITTFYKWLYIRGLMSPTNPSPAKYINNTLASNYGYAYADAADSNNVYVWLMPKATSSSLLSDINNSVLPLKPLTCEVSYLTPINKYFFPCAFNNGYNITNWDPNGENYIEIEVGNNSLVSFESLKSSVATYIQNYFLAANQTIGNSIDLNVLTSYILSITGVERVRTVFVNLLDNTDIVYINGISLACWTPDIINGEDVSIINTTFTLEPFQFAQLAPNTVLTNYINIITESSFQTNQVEY